jgi:hypothetical protein
VGELCDYCARHASVNDEPTKSQAVNLRETKRINSVAADLNGLELFGSTVRIGCDTSKKRKKIAF